MKFTRLFSALALSIFAVSTAAQAVTPSDGQRTLSVANWNDYIDEDTIADFEKRYGVTVNYETYVEHGELMAAIDSGKHDVIVPDSLTLGRLIADGRIQKFPASQMEGFKDLQPILAARMRVKDKDGNHAVPYMWGRIGVAVNVSKVKTALGIDTIPSSLDVVFSPEHLPKLSQCGITVLDSHIDVFSMLMHYKGRTLNNVSGRRVQEFESWLNDIAPYISKVDAADYLEDLPAGRHCVSMVWEGDGKALDKEHADIQFFLPKEGTALFIDSMTIAATSKNKDLAEKFIDFMASPEIAKRNAEYTAYNSPSSTAVELLERDGTIDPISMTEVPMFLPPAVSREIEGALIDVWSKFYDRVNSSNKSETAESSVRLDGAKDKT